jgi:hypothetical protein
MRERPRTPSQKINKDLRNESEPDLRAGSWDSNDKIWR